MASGEGLGEGLIAIVTSAVAEAASLGPGYRSREMRLLTYLSPIWSDEAKDEGRWEITG